MHSVDSSIQTIDVPAYLNPETLSELNRQFQAVDLDSTQLIFLKGGSGDIFCLGMDIHWVSQHQNEAFADEAQRFVSFLDNLHTAPCITICIVNGAVVGGGLGIVAASDFVIATQQSSFQLSEGLYGLAPGVILPFLLNRLTPQSVKKMVFTAQKFSPTEAMAMGLVDDVTTRDDLNTSIELQTEQLKRCKQQSVKDLKSLLAKNTADRNRLTERGISLLVDRLKDPLLQNRLENLAYLMDE